MTCNKNDDPELSLFYLSKVTTELYTMEYTYDGEKAIGSTYTEGGLKVTAPFTYDGGGNIMDINYSDNAHETISYSNGNIISHKKYDASNKLLSQWDYEYSDSQLTKVQYYDVADGIAYSAGFRAYEYDDTSADPARVKEFSSHAPTTPITTSLYNYGEGKDALGAAPTALKKYLRLLSASTEKNVVKFVDDTRTFNYTYEFNDRDYPAKRVETLTTGQTYTTTYDYIVIK